MKLHNMGGERLRKKLTSSQSRALKIIWDRLGLSASSKKLGVSNQNLVNWRLRGFVPLSLVGKASVVLNVSPLLLNYVGIYQIAMYLMYKVPPTWEELVQQDKLFSDSEKAYILAGSKPRLKF